MSFFESLRRILPGTHPDGSETSSSGGLVLESAGLFGESGADDGGPAVPPHPTSDFDRTQWHKKMKRVLERLPESSPEWPDLMLEAKALELDTSWVDNSQREEFLLLIRQAVADRVVTEDEHRKLDLARELIGIPEDEAQASLNAIVAEAESFFGKPVKEG
ncbi:hypothetical protein ACYOEI_25860 [Singulisphaera rosea]